MCFKTPPKRKNAAVSGPSCLGSTKLPLDFGVAASRNGPSRKVAVAKRSRAVPDVAPPGLGAEPLQGQGWTQQRPDSMEVEGCPGAVPDVAPPGLSAELTQNSAGRKSALVPPKVTSSLLRPCRRNKVCGSERPVHWLQ